jgi:hypothetical protein
MSNTGPLSTMNIGTTDGPELFGGLPRDAACSAQADSVH